MIVHGSRYQTQPVVMMKHEDGRTHATVLRGVPAVTNQYTYYQIKEGDRLDNLANAFYGRPDLWWKLADANPEMFYPEVLTIGAILRVPTS